MQVKIYLIMNRTNFKKYVSLRISVHKRLSKV